MTELAPERIISVPSRWALLPQDRALSIAEVQRLGDIINRGAEALCSCYMRMCDLIRDRELTDDEVRGALSASFPPPRISEILRVAKAPDSVYKRYRAGFFGFKAALAECRAYNVLPETRLAQARIRRAAERLVKLAGPGATVRVGKFAVAIQANAA